jgi:SAM-dependent methyltransferase
MTSVSRRLTAAFRDRAYRDWLFARLLASTGFDHTQWLRVAQQRAWHAWFAARPIADWHALEISPQGTDTWRLPFRSYSATQFPQFDICRQRLDRQFDVIIADQIWEHLVEPEEAARNVLAMLKPGGHFVLATPFLIRVHGSPHDYSRWTAEGLKRLLTRAGFADDVTVGQWGNRKCIAADLRRKDKWSVYGWRRDMRNEPDFPVTVWAFARKV